MCGLRRFLSVLGLLSALVIVAACGGDDGGGGEDAASGTDDGGSSGGCPSAVFEGEMSRDADPQQTEHEPVELTGDDIVSGLAVPVGDRYTVYLATYELDPATLGGTLTAPEGEVLATLNLPSEASTEATDGYLTVDSGAGAISTGSPVEGGIDIQPIEVGGDTICMTVHIEKDYELVDGTFAVPVG